MLKHTVADPYHGIKTAIKRNELLIHVIAYMNFQRIMMNEKS